MDRTILELRLNDLVNILGKIEHHLDHIAHIYGQETGNPYYSPEEQTRIQNEWDAKVASEELEVIDEY